MNGFAPSDKDGNYKRPKGFNCNNNSKINIKQNKSLILLLGATCPWCHRTLLITELKKLSEIQKIYLKPNFQNGEWIFENNFYGNNTLSDLYKSLNKRDYLRATVPLLLVTNKKKLEFISNESSEILEILNSFSNEKVSNFKMIKNCEKDLLTTINNDINNGVYKCGFARNQDSYIFASNILFQRLEKIDQLIGNSEGAWILGDNLTLADLYLFPTMIRWELIYSKLFKCTEKEISEYKNILNWRYEFFHLKGIPETCYEKDWIHDYYKGLFPLNPNQIMPLQPKLKEILKRNLS